MTHVKKIVAALSAVGMIAASAPVFAGEVEELRAAVQKLLARVEQLEAQKAAAPAPAAAPAAAAPAPAAVVVTAGDLPNSIKVPGTNTSLRVYGYVQTDATYDMRGKNSDTKDNGDWSSMIAAQPLNKSADGQRKGQLYMTARTSRLGIETSTASDVGPIGTKIEADFNAPNDHGGELLTNSQLFRLRHAYGTVGRFLVGQTWSNFSDMDSFVDSVDYNGVGTQTFVRQPQIRYTQPINASTSLAVAVENPQSYSAGTSTSFDRTPDVTARFTTKGNWGHLSASTIFQQYRNDQHSKSALGLGIGGSLKISANDTIVAQVKGGNGIGRYMLNSLVQSAYENGTGIDLWKTVGGHVGLTHAWAPTIRSNLIYAYTRFSGNAALESQTDVNQKINEAMINTFWTVAKNTEVGIEYAYGQRTTFANDKGTQNRINATFRYNLF
ncbi:DcaP family trimeric outer membrane transporter [Propionivibrio dicarboxylicus]|uniref:Porin subfamily protein n=1 Tax=Propionivibrio dicarboxylicus TaxID=83767 RepID=A0A1G7VGJ3_9RHOO|nr:DcaP family trimeric outer membrane transporter [Propionivibrio dicarboxylicus]SDG58853.1 Porin subfamily protein [Propionivibrio dicarboxylicus]